MNIKSKIIDISKKHKNLRQFLRTTLFLVKRTDYILKYYNNKVDDKLAIFECFNGTSYACSPKALYLSMKDDERFKDFKFIWVFKNPEEKKHFFDDDRVVLIKKNSKDYYRYYSKAKYWITNSLVDTSIKKKKNQIYVQTWHGTPLKKIRCDVVLEGSSLNSKEDVKKRNDKDAIRFDCFISPSKYATDCFKTAFNLIELKKEDIIIEEGYPRNDFLFNYTKEDIKRIKKNLKIRQNKKVILYAPTFRDNEHDSKLGYTYSLGLDFDKLEKELSDEYIILFRTHYFISNKFDFKKYKGFIYDVSSYDDINELYVISDLLITDYSSVFFDYANLKRPMLFYMYDYDEYKNNLRDFYIDVKELPGKIVMEEDKLVNAIKKCKINKTKYEKFNKKFNYLDGSDCSKKVINKIIERSENMKDLNNNKSAKYQVLLATMIVLVIGGISYFLYPTNKNIIIDTNKKGVDYFNNITYLDGPNSKYRLNIESSYGDIEAYHPKVLYFKEKWNGYHYWMVYTPYPNGDDRKENPHIMVSNDMINWFAPKENKALDTPDEPILFKKYNSDGVIVYNNDTDTLECYWRYVDDINNYVIMYRSTTKDGVNWTKKEEFLKANDRQKKDYVSPAVLYEDGTYKFWFIDKGHALKYMETKDLKNFTDEETITLDYDTKILPWHIDVTKSDKGYELIYCGYPSRKQYHFMSMYYTKSKDGKNFEKAVKIIDPTNNESDWDGQGLYKSTMVRIDGIYYVYYSGHNETIKGTSIAIGKNIKKLHGFDIDFKNDKYATFKFNKIVEREKSHEKVKKAKKTN